MALVPWLWQVFEDWSKPVTALTDKLKADVYKYQSSRDKKKQYYETYTSERRRFFNAQTADHTSNPESNNILLNLAKKWCWKSDPNERADSFRAMLDKLEQKVKFFKKGRQETQRRRDQGVAKIVTIPNIGKYVQDLLITGKEKTFKETELHHAAREGNLAKIVKLKEERQSNFDVDDEDQNRARPIHYAAKAGQHLVFEYLLKEGSQLGLTDRRGRGILHYIALSSALEYGHLAIIHILIAKEWAHIFNAPDEKGATAIHYLVRRPGFPNEKDWKTEDGKFFPTFLYERRVFLFLHHPSYACLDVSLVVLTYANSTMEMHRPGSSNSESDCHSRKKCSEFKG